MKNFKKIKTTVCINVKLNLSLWDIIKIKLLRKKNVEEDLRHGIETSIESLKGGENDGKGEIRQQFRSNRSGLRRL